MYTEKIDPVKACIAGIISFIFVVIVTYFLVWSSKNSYGVELQPTTHDSMTYTHTYDGEMIRVYVVTDPDYGQQYLVTDRGGITPRIKE